MTRQLYGLSLQCGQQCGTSLSLQKWQWILIPVNSLPDYLSVFYMDMVFHESLMKGCNDTICPFVLQQIIPKISQNHILIKNVNLVAILFSVT